MFAVLGASGNTGKVVAETLLSQNKKVRVVVRDVAKGQVRKEAGADVSIADVEDNAALKRAFSDTEGAYVLLPPNFSSTQVRAANNRRTGTIAAAIEAAGVPHVVLEGITGLKPAHRVYRFQHAFDITRRRDEDPPADRESDRGADARPARRPTARA